MVQTIEKQKVKETGPYFEAFQRFEEQAKDLAWLSTLRKAGISSFLEQGFPTLKDEDWRFTNVAPIAKRSFKPIFSPARKDISRADIQRFAFSRVECSRLVFIDGHYCQGFSPHLTPELDESEVEDLHVGCLRGGLSSCRGKIEKHLGRYASLERNPFAALNLAFFHDGAFIHIPDGTVIHDPVHLVFISTSREAGATSHPRNLIVVGANSKVTVIESHVSLGGAAYFTNAVTELVAGDRAEVELIKLQDEAADAFHIATIQGHFGRTSNVRVHSFALGARLSRNNIRAQLAGEGLECILNGLYLTRDEQLADHHMIVEHAEAHCASHEYFNGILDDKSKGVFHGRILVRPIAQKTDAKQTNKNLLLSDDATADTKPQLEIYADDVKCTHGATIGQLNDESIFYLRSRGIGPETARRMLIHAFAGEIIERIQCEPAREELDKLVWDRLEANPHLAEKR